MNAKTYHKYTNEELEYIKEHCRDDITDVATAIGAPRSTVAVYMRRFRNNSFVHRPHPAQKYYALYLRKTDELVCSGTAEECADTLGITTRAFYVMVHKALHNKVKKWDAYVEPFTEDDEC